MAEAAELAAIGGGALTPLLPPTANGQGGGSSSSRTGSAQKRVASTAPATLASVTASDSTFLTEQPGGGINDEVRALADEVARLKGIADRRRDPDTMSEASMSTMSASGSRRKGGGMNSASAIHGRAKEGHKSIGGVWMTAEDEARVDALLAEELAELEAAEGMMIQVPYGEGFMPCEEEARKLREIDAALESLLTEEANGKEESGSMPLDEDPFRPFMPPSESTAAVLPPPSKKGEENNGYDDYLTDMRVQRVHAEVESRVRDRLAALHTLPADAEPSDEEGQRLQELLVNVRAAAEKEVDSGDGEQQVS